MRLTPEIYEAQPGDVQLRAIPETQEVEFAFLPTGFVTRMSIEESLDLNRQLLDVLRATPYGATEEFRNLESSHLETVQYINGARRVQ